MIFNLIIALCMVTCFTLGVYFSDVVKRYVKRGLNALIGKIEDTPKSEQSGILLKTPTDRLDLYQSHKKVLAFKVVKWDYRDDGGYSLIGDSSTHSGNMAIMSYDYRVTKGISLSDLLGYVVVYFNEDNEPYYYSFSPKSAFELGYEKINKTKD